MQGPGFLTISKVFFPSDCMSVPLKSCMTSTVARLDVLELKVSKRLRFVSSAHGAFAVKQDYCTSNGKARPEVQAHECLRWPIH